MKHRFKEAAVVDAFLLLLLRFDFLMQKCQTLFLKSIGLKDIHFDEMKKAVKTVTKKQACAENC